jgi:hypothetical protein
MKFVTLISQNGCAIAVQPRHIVAVLPYAATQVRLTFVGCDDIVCEARDGDPAKFLDYIAVNARKIL